MSSIDQLEQQQHYPPTSFGKSGGPDQLERNFPPSFIKSIKKEPSKRSVDDFDSIFNVLRSFDCLQRYPDNYVHEMSKCCEYSHHNSNDILYCRGEINNYYFLLLCGSVFIDMNMFLPVTSFGRRLYPNQTRRPNECLILEPSDILCIPSSLDEQQAHAAQQQRPISSTYSCTSSEESSTTSSAGYSGSIVGSDDLLDFDGLVESMVDSDEEEEEEDDSRGGRRKASRHPDEEEDGDNESYNCIIVRDAVRECLEKDPLERTSDDIQILLEFTQHLNAFNDLTISVRRALCAVMVFAVVEKAGTIVLNHGEELDSWSVVVHGAVEIQRDNDEILLLPGDSFGLPPTLDTQWFQGEMRTRVDDCQFICVTQADYYRILKQGQQNQITHTRNNTTVLITELKQNSTPIIIRGTITELMSQLIYQDNSSIDPTYIEDFLLTYRIFTTGELLAKRLEEWFLLDDGVKDRVTRVVLLWVNNHFIDFEGENQYFGDLSNGLMEFLWRFQSHLSNSNMSGQLRLLQIACSAKSHHRSVTIKRSNRDEPLNFNIIGGSESGYGIYISQAEQSSKGLRPGDEIISINGQLCTTLSKTFDMIKNSTHVVLIVKCNFLGYHECLHSKIPLIPRHPQQAQPQQQITNTTHVLSLKKSLKKPSGDKSKRPFHEIKTFFKTIHLMPKYDKRDQQLDSGADELDDGGGGGHVVGKIDFPENVLKIYRSDQSYKYLLVNKETTAREIVMLTLQEYIDLQQQNSRDWYLFQVSICNGILKQTRLPENLDSLAERLPLGARYYIRHSTSTTQLIPDELMNELVRDSDVIFLQLNPLELALQLTLEDYTIFRQIDATEFIVDLFGNGVAEPAASSEDGDGQAAATAGKRKASPEVDVIGQAAEVTKDEKTLPQASAQKPNLPSALNVPTTAQQQSAAVTPAPLPPPPPASVSTPLQTFAHLVNRETFWVATEITTEPSINRRAAIIKRFIKIAIQCRECRNYNSMFAIISGLGHGAVSRLKLTWDKLGRKYIRGFEEIQQLMDPTRNMGKYRTLLSSSTTSSTPLIPFYPVIRKDLTFIHLGNSTYINNLINFEKMRMLSKEIRSIIHMSNLPFDTSQRPYLASMNQLGGVITTTRGKGRSAASGGGNEVNVKKMWEEMNMIRKIKTYLGRLKVIEDEELLYQYSFQCEPSTSSSSSQSATIRPANNARAKRPNSPTPSTSSSISSSTTGERASSTKFGSENYQKLMSLSERTSSRTVKRATGGGGSGGGGQLQASINTDRNSGNSEGRVNSTSLLSLSVESSSVLPAGGGGGSGGGGTNSSNK